MQLGKFFSLIIAFCLLGSSMVLFAQEKEKKRKKETAKKTSFDDFFTKKFTANDSISVLKLPKLSFKNINKIHYYHDPVKLTKIKELRENKEWELKFKALYEYVSNFGIRNFLNESDIDLVWQLARLAEYHDMMGLTKDLYRLIIKHYRGNLQDAIVHYDSLMEFEKDLWVDIEDYFRLVERRKAIDTLRPPEDILIRMGDEINSYHEDYGPSINESNDLLLFTSKRTHQLNTNNFSLFDNQINEDIYFSQRADSDYWSEAKKLQNINSKYNEGSPCLSKNGKELYFARCNSVDGYGDCDLYVSHKEENGEWGIPKNLGEEINSYAWDSHPALSITEDTLYFASSRKNGFGGTDIYYSIKKTDGSFGKPLNIGPFINTKNSEVSPFLHPINNVLYFSSNGQMVNFGRFDIYKSFKINDEWTEPKNVGPLVNGEGNEFYFTIDKNAQWLFYAKSEKKGDIGLDIHSFPLPMEAKPNSVVRFSGRVVEPKTGEVFEGVVSIIDMEDRVEVAPKRLRSDGTFEFDLINHKDYLLIVEGDNFFNFKEIFYLDGNRSVEIPAIGIHTKVTFNSIDFNTGSSEIKPSMENDLHLVIDFLSSHPKFNLKIIGHTDSDGSRKANLDLSQKRADAIKNYIAKYGGFNSNRIEAIGVGNSQPVVENEKTAEDKRLNRRVEFKVYDDEDEK